MRAGSVGWEIDIKLSSEEINRLEHKFLTGLLKVYNREKFFGNFPLLIGVRDIKREQLFVELETIPSHVYFEQVTDYFVFMSNEGYKQLCYNGSTGDRMYNNPGCKVQINLDENL